MRRSTATIIVIVLILRQLDEVTPEIFAEDGGFLRNGESEYPWVDAVGGVRGILLCRFKGSFEARDG